MKRILVLSIAALIICAGQAAALSRPGGEAPPVDRLGLILDGDFENGSCIAGSDWICAADNGCNWIVDIESALGLWNFSGRRVGWLGGFCQGIATCSSSLCQDVMIDGPYLLWYWMALVNDAVATVRVTVDGNEEFTYVFDPADNLLDYRATHYAAVAAYQGAVHTVCFEYENSADCGANLGDSYFFDFVQIHTNTPAARASFSTVKTLYGR